MLTELCQEINNWFDVERHFGTFTISGGKLVDADFLQDEQYYRIIGSVYNDGVYQFSTLDTEDASLKDEQFNGAIWAMAVPPSVIALASEIADWQTKYGDQTVSPYTSESFGGYSYSKAQGGGSAGESAVASWQGAFANRLKQWRKLG